MKKLAYDIIFVTVTSSVFAAIIIGALWVLTNYNATNNDLVLYQFVRAELSECTEKLGAYGDKIDPDISGSDITAQNLRTCLEKLKTYDESTILLEPYE